VTEYLIPNHLIALRREKLPNAKQLSDAEMIVFSAICQAVVEGSKSLAQYGIPEIASSIAILGGATRGIIEADSTIKK
jgi:hypothetical protein